HVSPTHSYTELLLHPVTLTEGTLYVKPRNDVELRRDAMKRYQTLIDILVGLFSSPTGSTLIVSAVVLPSLAISLLLLSSLIAVPAFATPPDRPIAVKPEAMERIGAIKASQGYFHLPLQVSVNDANINDVVITVVDTSKEPEKIG